MSGEPPELDLPRDPDIPSLRTIEQRGFSAVLDGIGIGDTLNAIELLKHQVGRCSFRVLAGDRRLHVKAYSERRSAAIDALRELADRGLASGNPPTAPPIVACDRRLGLLVTSWFEGPTGDDLIATGSGARAGELAAIWLRAAAIVDADVGACYGPGEALGEASRWARKSARIDEALGRVMDDLVDQLTARRPRSPRVGLRHGDFAPEHVIDLGLGPGVIDWDSFRRGPIEIDAAKFLAALVQIDLERPGNSPAIDAAAHAFWERAGDLLNEPSVSWYTAVVLIRLAKKLVREEPRPPHWRQQARGLLASANRNAQAS